ncbi:MAG TPA: hypothetical protein PK992_09500 [Planctomycetaceae bacterium]|nr:hypothetical protein [Planctomycetaceae bacterium]
MIRCVNSLLISFIFVFSMVLSSARSQDFSLGLSTSVVADDAKQNEPLVTKFYDVSLLVASQQPLLSVNNTPSGNGLAHLSSGGPSRGSGMGGGGMGGGGMGGVSTLPFVQNAASGNTVGAGIILGIIQTIVAPETWSNNGGAGDITSFGDILIVRQTAAVHLEIGEFLKSLTEIAVQKGTYQLEAWWLPLDEAAQIQLKGLLDGPLEESKVIEQLSTLCQNESGYHGTMLCREHVATHMSSGKETPVITGSTPVVGTGSSGDSPQVRILHLGLILQARISSLPGSPSAGEKSDAVEQLDLNFGSQVTGRDAKIQDWDQAGKIDRFVLGRHNAEGSCRVKIGRPTLIASLTRLSEFSDDIDGSSELQLVVRITRVDEP